jgi:hypothetical protein
MASDKVILYFAKHNNIGPFVIGKDILKHIERIIQVFTKLGIQAEGMNDKKMVLLRLLNVLQLLLNQFSIVLCY